MRKIKDPGIQRILLYLGITFGITFMIELGVITPCILSGDTTMVTIGTALMAFMMMVPAISVLLTRWITKEGFEDSWIRPNFKGHSLFYLCAWFGPAVLIAVGGIIYFMLFPGEFDGDFSYLASVYQQKGLELSEEQIQMNMITQLIVGVFLSPILNMINCFGEEWGWRGYLLPKLRARYRIVPTLLFSGVIWGLWHAPLTVLGHNYGVGYWGYPVTGILSMCIFCIVMGIFFSFLTIKTGSCLPAVIAHGALNGFASAAVLFTKDGGNPFIGPTPTGIIGGAGFILTAVLCLIILQKEEKTHGNEQPSEASV